MDRIQNMTYQMAVESFTLLDLDVANEVDLGGIMSKAGKAIIGAMKAFFRGVGVLLAKIKAFITRKEKDKVVHVQPFFTSELQVMEELLSLMGKMPEGKTYMAPSSHEDSAAALTDVQVRVKQKVNRIATLSNQKGNAVRDGESAPRQQSADSISKTIDRIGAQIRSLEQKYTASSAVYNSATANNLIKPATAGTRDEQAVVRRGQAYVSGVNTVVGLANKALATITKDFNNGSWIQPVVKKEKAEAPERDED